MSITTLKRSYHCWDDCEMSGCPTHTASLEYESVSDSLSFDDGKGRSLQGQIAEFEVLLELLSEFASHRAEIEGMLKRAMSQE